MKYAVVKNDVLICEEVYRWVFFSADGDIMYATNIYERFKCYADHLCDCGITVYDELYCVIGWGVGVNG